MPQKVSCSWQTRADAAQMAAAQTAERVIKPGDLLHATGSRERHGNGASVALVTIARKTTQ